jgi:hypothetical protein
LIFVDPFNRWQKASFLFPIGRFQDNNSTVINPESVISSISLALLLNDILFWLKVFINSQGKNQEQLRILRASILIAIIALNLIHP